MNTSGALETERFRGWIARRLGLQFDDGKLGFLAEVLVRRADANGRTPTAYLDVLDGPHAADELRALAPDLTVPETYFFRHYDQFRAFTEVALPERLAARTAGTMVQVLCAGCASGEEPYSLAILLQERVPNTDRTCAIRAVDINPVMLQRAARARYSSWALRETPEEIRERWFASKGREAELDARIRTAVLFEERNLASDEQLWAPESYDIIFCRNVLMYFTPEQVQLLVARFTRSLVPGGYLFLGHAETLRGLSNEYALRHTHDTFYYQRKIKRDERDSVISCNSILPSPSARAAPVSSPPEANWTTTWIETVQRSSDRIDALTRRSALGDAALAPSDVPPASMATTGLQLALEFLKQDRFAEALDVLSRMPAVPVQDPDVLLLRAALLTHSGQLTGAERACRELLDCDELNTGGHYLLALCREGAGDRQGAFDHDQAAVYLDPAFAMPRLHLGLMARRGGDRDTARRELGGALRLLQAEDASRLLLFGGGFGREALVALCRAELNALGERS